MLYWKWRWTHYSPFTHYGHFTLKRNDPYTKTFSTFSGVFLILPLLDILCTGAVKQYCATNDNSPYTCHLVSLALEFTKARKACHRIDRTSVGWVPYSGELCNKNCIVKTSDTLIIWSASCYTAGSDKSSTMEGVPDRLLKRGRMCLGYTVDMLNCCWPTDVHSQQWLSFSMELCAIIQRHA